MYHSTESPKQLQNSTILPTWQKFPLVSVIVANYNNGRYIDLCIRSLVKQSYSQLEIIIIDDASTDNSITLLKDWENKEPRLTLLQNELNQGIAETRNRGIAIAKGKYIAIMDGDDVGGKFWLEKTVEYLEDHSDIFLVGSSVYIMDEFNNILGMRKVPISPEIIQKLISSMQNPFLVNTILFRNDHQTRFRGKFAFCEDIDFYLTLFTEGKKLRNLPDTLVFYRQNPMSVSFSKKTKMALFFQKAMEFYQQRLTSGTDSYPQFDPLKILDMDIAQTQTTDRQILEYEILSHFQINQFTIAKKLTRQFFSRYGYLTKNLYYYWASTCPGVAFIGRKLMKILEELGIHHKLVRKIII